MFVDTGAWYASFVKEDPAHETCRRLLSVATTKLVTTDFVLDELLTLLTVRGHRDVARQIGPKILDEEITDLHWITPQNVAAAWEVFTRFDDKLWSFTDCTSYAVMRQLKIDDAFALDEHFRQFGLVNVWPH